MRSLLFLVLPTMLTACSHAAAVAPTAPAPSQPSAPTSSSAPAPAVIPTALLSEGFESDTARWYLGGKGYDVGVDPAQAHEGRSSLRLTFREAGEFGVSSLSVPVGNARGQEATLSGWIKTDSVVGGFAGLWLRIDGADGKMLALDNMQEKDVHGTTPWTRYEISLPVPEDAEHFVLGGILTGNGSAWIDDLRLDAAPPRPRERIAVAGVVEDTAGKPVAGALVAIVPPDALHAEATTSTDASGRFQFEVFTGRYALTASAAGLSAGYRSMTRFDGPAMDATVTVGAGPAFMVTGKALVSGAAPHAGDLVVATRWSRDDGDLFYAATDGSGAFALTLPAARGYSLALDDRNVVSAPMRIIDSVDRTVELTGTARAPAPDAVVDWMRQSAIPIATADPAHDVSDLEPLGAMVGAATVVGLGEATHGSREFFQLKHRVLEYLVERKGFTVFAIEASYPESLAVNDYVLHGTGDPQKALAGMYFWTWNVQEVLAQIDWMRQWNADPKHAKKVKFIGFDMQTACVGVARALEYVDKVDPAAAKTARTSLAPLSCENEQKYRRLPAEQHTATAKALVDLLDLFDRRKPAWSARTSRAAWAIARQHAAVASQAERQESGAGLDWRDESMAKNVRWILDNEPRGTRMVVWAHNGHVGVQGSEPWVPMGAHLSKQLGKAYLPVGFVFDHGAFQAMNGAYRLGEQHVGQAPAGDLAEAFHRVQTPIFALDLRLPPAGIVADWLNAPHSMREVGAMFSNEESTTSTVILPRRFDAVIYVDETTRARPL